MFSEIKRRWQSGQRPRRGWILFVAFWPLYWLARQIVNIYEYADENY